MDLKAQSFKILREYFDWDNEDQGDFLTARLHVVAGQNIKMPGDADAVVEMMRNTIRRHEDALEPLHQTTAPRTPRPFSVLRRPVVQMEETAREDTDSAPDEPEEVFDWSKFDILVIYDSARRIHEAEESQSNQMSEVSDALAKIERETGATTIVLQHENRGGTFKGDTVIMDSAQQAYQLKCPKSRRNDPVREITVKVEKNRGLSVKPFLVQFAWTGQETGDQKITFSFVREITTEEADAGESRGRTRSPRLVGMTVLADPILEAARKVWQPGMSQRALGTAIREGGVSVSSDRLKKLHKSLQAEGKMSLGT